MVEYNEENMRELADCVAHSIEPASLISLAVEHFVKLYEKYPDKFHSDAKQMWFRGIENER